MMTLVCIKSVFSFRDIFSNIIKITDFKNRVITHLQRIFREDIDNSSNSVNNALDIDGGSVDTELPPAMFHKAIINDGHGVASRKNMHRHSYTCMKYGSTQCRFGCPWPLEPITRVDEEG